LDFARRLKTSPGTENILHLKINFAIEGTVHKMVEDQVKHQAEMAE
jgi:hypothetical protein